MAGHSKWKNIQHRKGAQDKKKGKVFTKIAKELTIATRISGPDPESNPRLRLGLLKARAANMPRDNIERAIKKGTGDLEGDMMEERNYEGYAPGGIAVIVECLSDNANRTVSEVRHAFTRAGGSLGTEGSVSYMFSTKGMLVFEKSVLAAKGLLDSFMEKAIETGAEDIDDEGEALEVYCAPADFTKLKDSLDTFGVEPLAAEITKIPSTTNAVDADHQPKIQKLLEALEDLEDVQNVYHNAEGDFD